MAAALAGGGVRSMFAYPGESIIELMELSRRRGIDVVLARREATAAFMAEASAMATGGIGCCVSTLGPGSTALVNGVAAATLDRVPVVAISGQIETSRQAFCTHQVVNHEARFSPVTKWAGRVEASAAATSMRKALRVATAERPGAVHLTCAADTFKAPATDRLVVTPPVRYATESVQVFGGAEIASPGRMLAAARRPLLLAGIGAVRCEATAAIERLAATVQMPIVVTGMAKGIVPEDSEWFAGVLDMACNESVWEVVHASDLILAAGFDPVELIKPWHVEVTVLHIGTIPNVDQVYASEVEAVGNVGDTLNWLADDYQGEHRWTAAEVAGYRSRLRAAYYAGRVRGRLNPTDVIDTVRETAAANAIATCDVGSHKLLVGQGWTTTLPRSVLMTNGLSAMGFGLPAAIAAKLAYPDRPVVAMIGDGCFQMTCGEVAVARRLGLSLPIVVLDDGWLSLIQVKQVRRRFGLYGTDLGEQEHVDPPAHYFGVPAVGARSAGELTRALKDALAA